MMTIKVNIPLVDRPQRLEYVLRFAFNLPPSGVDIKLEIDSDLHNEMSWNIQGKEARYPLDVIWLGKDFQPVHPGNDLKPNSPGFWYYIFFYLSRLEEALHTIRDQHGRWIPPPPDAEWPDRTIPFVDEMIADFMSQLCRDLELTELDLRTTYTPVLSIDVDQWYAYKRKSWLRNLQGGLRDLIKGRLDRIWRRILTVLGDDDPYDTLDRLHQMAEKEGIPQEMFVLMRSKTQWDRQVELSSDEVKKLTLNWKNIGLHPSYFSVKEGRIKKEKEALEDKLDRRVTLSRFHYLRFDKDLAPDTLTSVGLEADKSHSIPNNVGFLSGTCKVHHHYDLQNDKVSDLRLYPQIAMDVTMKDYLGWSPDEVSKRLMPLIDACKKYQGYCSVIWHNSSFYEYEGWSGWDKSLKDLLQMMKK